MGKGTIVDSATSDSSGPNGSTVPCIGFGQECLQYRQLKNALWEYNRPAAHRGGSMLPDASIPIKSPLFIHIPRCRPNIASEIA